MSSNPLVVGFFDSDPTICVDILFVKECDNDVFVEFKNEFVYPPKISILTVDHIPPEDIALVVLFGVAHYLEKFPDGRFELSVLPSAASYPWLHLLQTSLHSLYLSQNGDVNQDALIAGLRTFKTMLPVGYFGMVKAIEILEDFYNNVVFPLRNMLLYTSSFPILHETTSIIKIIDTIGKQTSNNSLPTFLKPFHTCLTNILGMGALHAPLQDKLFNTSIYALWLSRRELSSKNQTVSLLLLHRACDLFFQSLCADQRLLFQDRYGAHYFDKRGAELDRVSLMNSISYLKAKSLYVIGSVEEDIFQRLNALRNESLLTHGNRGFLDQEVKNLHEQVKSAIKTVSGDIKWSSAPNRLESDFQLGFADLLKNETALNSYIKLIEIF